MEEKQPASVRKFYDSIAQRRLVGTRCESCGHVSLPPRQICEVCKSTRWDLVELKGNGKLETYTVVHVAPQKFAKLAPYVVGVIRLEEGSMITSIIKDVKPEQVKIGMELTVDYGDYEGEPTFFFKPKMP